MLAATAAAASPRRSVLHELSLEWLPVHRDWRLNERHYGALQGLNKVETAAKHGDEQVKIWRRSYDIPPPPLEASDPRHPSHDRRYGVYGLAPAQLPATESLKETVARVLPAWHAEIAPAIKSGKRVGTGGGAPRRAAPRCSGGRCHRVGPHCLPLPGSHRRARQLAPRPDQVPGQRQRRRHRGAQRAHGCVMRAWLGSAAKVRQRVR